ncbi:hypothetical protein E2C01_088496 [Portunus trituberculatus]|uniref:Uncharacterized protein n=1 Tax=Portunus trituberculatus TaxID=210409 RepID=A0A5B7J9E7_PORTR|nr:hypothetical protein [Portunus trituberculatus]
MNNTKSVKKFKQGTLLESFEHLCSETINDIQAQKVHHTLEIQNDLLPANDQVKAQDQDNRRTPEKY